MREGGREVRKEKERKESGESERGGVEGERERESGRQREE